MVHFLGQLFVTLWPIFQTLALAPLAIVFWPINSTSYHFILTPLAEFIWTALGSLGCVFLFWLLLRLFPQKKSFDRLTTQTKVALVGIFMGSVYGVIKLVPGLFALFDQAGLLLIPWLCVLVGVSSLLWYGVRFLALIGKNWIQYSPVVKTTLRALGFVFVGYPFFAVIVVLTWIFLDPLGSIADYRLHTLHAAIKNTCILDPLKENCPQKLEDIRVIVPEVYDEIQNCCQMKYEYDPTSNEYVFVVRYSPTQAAMFSNRFLTETDWGVDYKEMTVTVWGRDELQEPLLPGDWAFPEWKYRLLAPRTF